GRAEPPPDHPAPAPALPRPPQARRPRLPRRRPGRAKHQTTDFFERHIYQGNGSQLCLHDYVAALSRTPLELEAVYNDRHNYALTTRGWAENLDRHREEIESRWGRAQYRKFQLYLWGCVDGFTRDIIQAYRLVLHRP